MTRGHKTCVYSLEPSRRAQRTTPGQLRVHTPYIETGVDARRGGRCSTGFGAAPTCATRYATVPLFQGTVATTVAPDWLANNKAPSRIQPTHDCMIMGEVLLPRGARL